MGEKRKNISRILVSQPGPTDGSNPYAYLMDRHKMQIDFQKFVDTEAISLNDFRKNNINPLEYTGIIFTNKTVMDHFFRLTKEMRIEMPPETKYFCVGDATAKYLHRYIVIRKRKLFVAEKSLMDLTPFLDKHSKEKFLFPGSDVPLTMLTDYMRSKQMSVEEVPVYQTITVNISDIEIDKYDIICLYSPRGVQSLFNSFPEYTQNDTLIAVFGEATAKEAKERGLSIHIEAPKPNVPSLVAAIENYMKEMPTK